MEKLPEATGVNDGTVVVAAAGTRPIGAEPPEDGGRLCGARPRSSARRERGIAATGCFDRAGLDWAATGRVRRGGAGLDAGAVVTCDRGPRVAGALDRGAAAARQDGRPGAGTAARGAEGGHHADCAS